MLAVKDRARRLKISDREAYVIRFSKVKRRYEKLSRLKNCVRSGDRAMIGQICTCDGGRSTSTKSGEIIIIILYTEQKHVMENQI